MIFLVMLWQLFVDFGLVKRFILPSPTDVIKALAANVPDLLHHSSYTLLEAAAGFSLSISFAFLLSMAMDSIKILKRALYPMLIVSQTVPIIALAPLFVMWFGFGIAPKIIVVILVCFFPIAVSLLDGLDSIDPDIINLMKSMGASKLQIFRQVKFPAAIVSFFSGLRIAATYSIMGAVIGEWLGGMSGLGVYMMRVKHSYTYDKMFAAILVIVVLSMLVFRLISLLQSRLMPWHNKLNEK
ncbi:MAG: ABC transporter permease [Bacillota bacterium]